MTAASAAARPGPGPAPEPTVRQVTEDLVLVEIGDRKVLAAARCPHRQGKLKFGRVDGDRLRITCPLHYSTFDLASGERTSGPACDTLRVLDALPGHLAAAPPPTQGDTPHGAAS
ncbi:MULTISPECIES: Rieske (2Fe-2S) protein [unclassified Streptomyces]|uniref:Rieske (2Fe-2S) protein n=1 Tax=unclassified Streptomyces TaxID=2593676 RepID=UPI0033C71126